MDDFSSKLDLPRAIETVESIDVNHLEMAKCHDRKDPRYRAILGVLNQYMRSRGSGGANDVRVKPILQSLAKPASPL